MRIAQVAPLAEAVPPKLYGGTERVVSWLTEELVHRGHEVTLSQAEIPSPARRWCRPALKPLRLAGIRDHLASHIVLMRDVRRLAEDFDIIHFHVDLVQYAHVRRILARKTHHARSRAPGCSGLHARLSGLPGNAADLGFPIINATRMPPDVNWLGTIPHGLPKNLVPFDAEGGGEYLAFLGRISPEKRPDRAIKIAKRAGIPLRIAAKVDRVRSELFRSGDRAASSTIP